MREFLPSVPLMISSSNMLLSSVVMIVLLVSNICLTSATTTSSSNVRETKTGKLLQSLDPSTWVPWAQQPKHDRENKKSVQRAARVDLPCNVCLGVGQALIGDIADGITVQEIIDAVVPFCSFFLYDEDACIGVLQGQAPVVAWVMGTHPNFDLNRFCAEGIGAVGCDDFIPNPDLWVVELPDTPKPPVVRPQVPEGTETVKILQITDMHLDLIYEAGSEAVCNKITCCQSINGPANDIPAGLFGSYEECDTPIITVQATLDHIVAQHPDIDLVLFTGDFPAHDIWRQTVADNTAAIQAGMAVIRQAFPNTPVLCTLGNHAPHPLNVFSFDAIVEEQPPAELLSNWIYDVAWEEWATWLPADQEPSVRKSARFSVLHHDGLRVIGFNDLFAYDNNWFIWLEYPDPNGELAWLANELQAAEDAGEAVMLLSHVPPGSMVPVWNRNFQRIVNRYEGTIRAQFYGHTHNDEFRVFYNDQGAPSNVAFIGPSITSYTELNPGYRIFYADGARGADSTWAITDIETWLFDLEPANESGTPEWYKFYNFKETYGVPDLSPASFDALARSFRVDDAAFDFYYNAYWKNSPRKPDCDAACRDEFVCDAVTADSSDISRC